MELYVVVMEFKLQLKNQIIKSLKSLITTPTSHILKSNKKIMKQTTYFFLLIILVLSACNRNHDRLFYKKAEILDIKRDDDSQFHLLVKFSDGTVESYADAHGTIKMGEYTPSAKIPFVKCGDCKKDHNAMRWNDTKYHYEGIIIYLPVGHKIDIIID